MSFTSKNDPDPTGQRLGRELDAWAAARMTARFWWRDDDAISDTPQLRRLLHVARDVGIAPALAVIPERVDNSLVRLLATADCAVWQHGWGHHFHGAGEFGDGRPLHEMMADALKGQRALDNLFGASSWQRVFVPPNHMLSILFKAVIPGLGYLGVSAGDPLTPSIEHVAEVNAEVDVMDWPRGTLLSGEAVSDMLVKQLEARRRGAFPAKRPIGVLTHHLAFDDGGWEFVAALLRLLRAHRAVEWLRADTLFTAAPASPPSRGTADITVVITSCLRQDLLDRTLDSFLKHNTYPVREFIVMEDGDGAKNRSLEAKYREHQFRWLSTGRRIGQMPAIDEAYAAVETEFIFHCEDDWEFYAPGFIEKSLAVLTANEHILQVWIRALADTNNHPVMDHVFLAGGVPYRLLQPGFHSEEWGTWHGFSFSPGLRRRRDYAALGSFGAFNPRRGKKSYEVEREISEHYLRCGLLAAILADNDGKGYVRHIGWGRRVGEPETDQSK